LCFNELDSAKARREENRGDRLPEPLALDAGGIGHVEMLDQISMAFLVVLQRLAPAERAVLLLRDVFNFDYTTFLSWSARRRPRTASSSNVPEKTSQRKSARFPLPRKPTSACSQPSHKPRPQATSTRSFPCWQKMP
jgi:hypothetical protein